MNDILPGYLVPDYDIINPDFSGKFSVPLQDVKKQFCVHDSLHICLQRRMEIGRDYHWA